VSEVREPEEGNAGYDETEFDFHLISPFAWLVLTCGFEV